MENSGKRKLLIVEDERDLADMMKCFSEEAGFETYVADNYFDAIKTLRANGQFFEVITDGEYKPRSDSEKDKPLYLPLTRFVKKTSPATKVVVCSAQGDYEARAKQAGADDFKRKPVMSLMGLFCD